MQAVDDVVGELVVAGGVIGLASLSVLEPEAVAGFEQVASAEKRLGQKRRAARGLPSIAGPVGLGVVAVLRDAAACEECRLAIPARGDGLEPRLVAVVREVDGSTELRVV